MIETLLRMVDTARNIGTVTDVSAFSDGNTYISGDATDGRQFSLHLTFMEVKKNAEEV